MSSALDCAFVLWGNHLPLKMWVSHSGTSMVLPLGGLPARRFWVANGPVKEARDPVGSSALRSSRE